MKNTKRREGEGKRDPERLSCTIRRRHATNDASSIRGGWGSFSEALERA